MNIFGRKRNWHSGAGLWNRRSVACFLLVLFAIPAGIGRAQTPDQESLAQRVQQLTDAMARTQARVEESQRELNEMRKQLTELQHEMGKTEAVPAAAAVSASAGDSASASPEAVVQSMSAAIEDLRERQAVDESQIATHEQSKVESESKYPVKITGMLLMNGFVNTGAVDTPATPSVAVGGSGNTGASVRQTMLGLDAWGPHLFGARSFGDLRVDFYGSAGSYVSAASYNGANPNPPAYPASNTNTAFLRLRTAHAGLYWDKIQAYFALDRPIINPDAPTSLTAVAVPALAWSGNLWTWNPQAVLTGFLGRTGSRGVQLQAALIDAWDAPLTPQVVPSSPAGVTPAGNAEQSSRPGVEARAAMLGAGREDERNHIGVGGYFAPHRSALGRNYDSWAATLDTRLALFAHLQMTGNFYRGLALGGLGGGGYKDFAYSPNPNTGGYYFRALNDVGGWAQLKETVNERLEFNAAYGMDNVFAYDLKHYFVSGGPMVENLARNRTLSGNVIYSPSAYLLFSLEYRRLESYPVTGAAAESNIIGIGAGYKF